MQKVITIGEMLAEVMRKDVDVSLEEPAEFVGPFPSGAPAIFIDAVARLGMKAGIIGSVGRDGFGECILKRLRGDGVDSTRIKQIEGLSTGVAFVSYSSNGSRKFIFHMGNSAAGAVDPSDVPKDYVEGASAVHISGSSLAMGERMRESCYKLARIAERARIPISFDPNVRIELLGVDKIREIIAPVLKASQVLLPSLEELKMITGVNDEEKAAEQMLGEGIETIAIKKGKKGCAIYTKDGKVKAPAFDLEEVDPTGAGDAFSAGIVVGKLENMDLERMALFANAVGGKAITRRGPMEGLAWRREIDEMIQTGNLRNMRCYPSA